MEICPFPVKIGLFGGVGEVPEIICSEPRCADGSTTIFIPHFMEYNRPAPEYNRPAPEYNRPALEYNRPSHPLLLKPQKGMS